MGKEDLIMKWLDNNLNDEELKEFKSLEDYDHLIKISDGLKQFNAPEINEDKILNTIISQNKKIKKPIVKLITAFSAIAAVFLICFGAYYFILNQTTTISTELAHKTIHNLPDNSIVHLNAGSNINFNENSWNEKRTLTLDGEAYFKVAKGSKFDVVTNSGTVSVLGTQFNVKNRGDNFEVVCYEGLVSVKVNNKTVKLSAGDSFKLGIVSENKIIKNAPFWINNESDFKSEPVINVIKEFERQYNVSVQIKNIDKSMLYTGRFVHNDINVALKSITLPLNINYSKKGNEIIFNGENSN